uniref:Uncharacterized protein n=1 Tax=Anguilla anguilla TaxID=7936 RepID=A0A0E9RNF5_ANGAN
MYTFVATVCTFLEKSYFYSLSPHIGSADHEFLLLLQFGFGLSCTLPRFSLVTEISSSSIHHSIYEISH